jgi:sporulation protein YlmC with PRC-barrel domain
MSMKRTTTLTAALFVGALAIAPAYAAGDATMPTKSLVEIDNNDVVVSSMGMKVGDLEGKNVYGADGKKVGDIATVLADAQQKAQAVTIDVGGFLGVGTKNVVMPLESLKPGPKKDTLSTSLTKAQIEQLAEWKR